MAVRRIGRSYSRRTEVDHVVRSGERMIDIDITDVYEHLYVCINGL